MDESTAVILYSPRAKARAPLPPPHPRICVIIMPYQALSKSTVSGPSDSVPRPPSREKTFLSLFFMALLGVVSGVKVFICAYDLARGTPVGILVN